nr:unnamed protein product [Callosobruchus analis]
MRKERTSVVPASSRAAPSCCTCSATRSAARASVTKSIPLNLTILMLAAANQHVWETSATTWRRVDTRTSTPPASKCITTRSVNARTATTRSRSTNRPRRFSALKTRHHRHRFGNANLAPPILFSSDPGKSHIFHLCLFRLSVYLSVCHLGCVRY